MFVLACSKLGEMINSCAMQDYCSLMHFTGVLQLVHSCDSLVLFADCLAERIATPQEGR